MATSATNSTIPLHLSEDGPISVNHASGVVSFLIGLSIVLLASILNAAGLNLTKLDHVRTSAVPKANRRKDWQRPLWLLGMILYILSQLLGSTLALEYMRAEYVAPLGSSSLVFNFLFARFLVGTPVTSTDISGTIVVVLGVIGIVAFGSINSGLATETDVIHLTYLWRRGGWLGFFFAMATALTALLLATNTLDAILASRSDLSGVPFSGMQAPPVPGTGYIAKARHTWRRAMHRLGDFLENWSSAKDDKTVAWTLGIGWACCGGGLAGGTLVFAKAVVQLLSGSLSHENQGNQFGHVAPIFTIILLVCTAVLQIICLNRGLKVYDSTLVVPVFYGVYTATGFLNSLIFNNEVDSYQSWTLFLIFVSILILISGVVLLTHKKPEPGVNNRPPPPVTSRHNSKPRDGEESDDEEAGLNTRRDRGEDEEPREDIMWEVGDASDDEDEHDPQNPRPPSSPRPQRQRGLGETSGGRGDEGVSLIDSSRDRDD